MFKRFKILPVLVAVITMGMSSTAFAQAEASTNIGSLLRAATQAEEAGDLREAFDNYRQIVEISEYNSEVAYKAGTIAAELGDNANCVLYLRRYLMIAPPNSSTTSVRSTISSCERAMPRSGTVEIATTRPPNARLEINDVIIGQSQLELITLPAGTYTLKATAPDYVTLEQELVIRNGQRETPRISLTSARFSGTLTVNVDQPGAVVELDGEPIDVTGDEPLEYPTGGYYLTVRKDGFRLWQRNIEINREINTNLDVYLIRDDVDVQALIDRCITLQIFPCRPPTAEDSSGDSSEPEATTDSEE